MVEFLSISTLIDESQLLFDRTEHIDSKRQCMLFVTSNRNIPYFKSHFVSKYELSPLITSNNLNYHKLNVTDAKVIAYCKQLDTLFVKMISKQTNKSVVYKPLVRNDNVQFKVIRQIKSSTFSTDFITEIYDKKGKPSELDVRNSNIAFIIELIGCMFNEKNGKCIASIIMRLDQLCIEKKSVTIPSNKLSGFQFSDEESVLNNLVTENKNDDLDMDELKNILNDIDDIVPEKPVVQPKIVQPTKSTSQLNKELPKKYPVHVHNNSTFNDEESDNEEQIDSCVITTYVPKKRTK